VTSSGASIREELREDPLSKTFSQGKIKMTDLSENPLPKLKYFQKNTHAVSIDDGIC
jgi:hypothetical protein